MDMFPGDNLDKSRPRQDMSRRIDTFEDNVKYRPENIDYNSDMRTDKHLRNDRLPPSSPGRGERLAKPIREERGSRDERSIRDDRGSRDDRERDRGREDVRPREGRGARDRDTREERGNARNTRPAYTGRDKDRRDDDLNTRHRPEFHNRGNDNRRGTEFRGRGAGAGSIHPPPRSSDRRDNRNDYRGRSPPQFHHNKSADGDHRRQTGGTDRSRNRPSRDQHSEDRDRDGPIIGDRGDVKSRLGGYTQGQGGVGAVHQGGAVAPVQARLGDRQPQQHNPKGKGFVKDRLGNYVKEKSKPSHFEHDIRGDDDFSNKKGGGRNKKLDGDWSHDMFSEDNNQEPTSTTN